MRKDILLSLLAASAVPFSALADADASGQLTGDNGKWTGDGLEEGLNIDELDLLTNTATVTLLGGKLECKTTLPAGKYFLTIGTAENVKFTVNGQTIEATDGHYAFEITGEGSNEVTLAFTSLDGVNGFKVGQIALTLDFDFEALYNKLNADLSTPINELYEEDENESAKQLRETLKELQKRIADAQAAIDKFKNDEDWTLATYRDEELGLFNEPSLIEETVEGILQDIQNYNEAVDEENALYLLQQNNLATLNEWIKYLLPGKTAIDGINEYLEGEEVDEYVKGVCEDGGIADLTANYDGFVKDAEAVDISLSEEDYQAALKELMTKYDIMAFNKEASKLDSLYKMALKDVAAFAQYNDEVLPALTRSQQKAINDIYNIENLGSGYATEIQNQIKDIYQNAVDTYQITEIAGAFNKLQETQPAYEEAAAQMQALVDQVKSNMEAMGDTMTAATEALDALKERLATLEESIEETEDADIKTGLQGDAEDIDAAIKNLESVISNAFNEGNLTEDTYSESMANITSQLDNLDAKVAAAAVINDLQVALKEAQEAITEAQDTLHPVVPVLASPYEILVNAINTLAQEYLDYEGDFADFEFSDNTVAENIAQYKKLGVEVAKTVKDAYANYQTLYNGAEAFIALVNNMNENGDIFAGNEALNVKGNKKVNIATTLETIQGWLEGDIKGLKESIDAAYIGNDNAQNLLDEVQKINTNPGELLTLIPDTRAKFVADAATGNWGVCSDEINTLQMLLQASNAPAIIGTAYESIKEECDVLSTALKTEIQEALNAAPDVTVTDEDGTINEAATVAAIENAYAEVTVTLKAWRSSLDTLLKKIDTCKANTKALQELQDKAEALTAVDGNIAALKEYIDNNSLDFANKAWLEQVAEIEEAIQKLLDDAADACKTASDEGKAFDNTEWLQQLSAQEAAITAMYTAIDNNERYHNQQLDLGEDVAAAIEEVVAKIDAKIADNADPDGTLAESLETLKNLQKQLAAVNADVQKAYNATESKEQNKAIEEAYNEILAQVQEINASLLNEYQTIVKDANDETAAQYWTPELDKLDQVYIDAVNAYIYYSSNTNVAYHDALLGAGLKDHATDIYGFAAQIRQLRAEVKAMMEEAIPGDDVDNLEDIILLTEEDFQPYIDQAQSLVSQIENKEQNMKDTANAFAETYYNNVVAKIKSYNSEAETALTNGLPEGELAESLIEEALATNNSALENAALAKDKATEDGDLSPAMDTILALLEASGVGAINTEAVANTYWSNTYEETAQALSDALENVQALANEGYNVQPQINAILALRDGKDQLDETTGEVVSHDEGLVDLNEEATEDYASETLLNNLKNLCNRAASLVAAAENEVQAAQDKKTQTDTNKAVYDQYVADIEALQEKLDTASALINTLGMPETSHDEVVEYEIKPANSYITTAKELLEQAFADESLGDPNSSNVQLIDNYISWAQGNIAWAYIDGCSFEKQYLNDRVHEVQLAFNEMVVSGDVSVEQIDEFNASISDIQSRISAINPWGITEETAPEVYAELIKIEGELNDIEIDIDGAHGVDTVQDAIDALNKVYDQTNADLTELTELLDSCLPSVQEAYRERVDALVAELEAIHAEYEGMGSTVVGQVKNLTTKMENISKTVMGYINAIREAEKVAQAEKAIRDASDARAAVLQSQIDGLSDDLASAKDLVASYEELSELEADDWNEFANYISGLIETQQEWLDAQKEAYALTEESNLPDATSISTLITYLEQSATYQETKNIIEAARKAVADAAAEINDGKHADQEGLNAQLSDLQDALSGLDEIGAVRDVEEGQAVIDAAKTIINDANALLKAAQEDKVIVGDIDSDGEITVSDLYELIKLMLSVEEYDPTNPLHVAGDVNGNGRINGADLTALIHLYMEESPTTVMLKRAKAPAPGNNNIAMAVVEENDGVRRVAVNLSNSDIFVNGQFDIVLPEGMQVVGASLGERAAMHTLYTNELSNGNFRVFVGSTQIVELPGTDGAILYFDIEGRGDFSLENVVFSDKDGREFFLGKAEGTTGLETFTDYVKEFGHKIYNLGGMMMNKLQKGINIIRHGDGTTEKQVNND